ncbi:MAG: hypothetical protein ABIT38_11060, partial [Gemmatimonadaceae bacterium]
MTFIVRALIVATCTTTLARPVDAQRSSAVRARELGIPFAGTPGPFNSITDIPGVEVGYATLIKGA